MPGERPRLDLASAVLPLELPATRLDVDQALFTSWLAALGENAAASLELASRGVAPPQCFTGNTILLAFSHYDLTGGIYAREQVTYRRPVRLGEALWVSGQIAATYRRRGRRYRLMTSATRDEHGEVVVESRSTGIESIRSTGGADADEEPPPVAAPGPHLPAGATNPCRPRLAALRSGESFTGSAQMVTLEMMRAAAGREDRNPIHTDPEVARRHGLDAPIAGGPHVLAFAQELLMRELGGESLLHGGTFDVRWLRPVRPGDEVVPRAEVGEVHAGALDLRLEMLGTDAALDSPPFLVGTAVLPL